MSATRVYLVEVAGQVDYLVRASSPSAALHHVTRRLIGVRVATQDDLIACLVTGTAVEVAGQPAPAEAPAPPDLPLWPHSTVGAI